MENLKSYEVEEVPDLGQDYWMQSERMERCKGLGTPKSIGITVALSTLSYLLAHAAILSKSLLPISDMWTRILVAIAATLSIVGCVVVGCAALGVGIVGTVNALQQRRWRRALPPRPENYSEEMAKKAYHLEFNVNSYNTLLSKTEEAINDLHVAQSEIEHGLDFTQHYLEAMSEDDVEVLTLHSYEESRS